MTVNAERQVVTTVAPGSQGETGEQKQSLTILIDGTTVPRARISLAEVYMPGSHQSVPHRHAVTPMIVYITDGAGTTHFGPAMRPLPHDPRSMVYVPEGLPHAASNRLPGRLLGLEARRIEPGGAFNDDVQTLPELQPALTTAPRYPVVDEQPAPRGDGPFHVDVTTAFPGVAGAMPIIYARGDRGTVSECWLSAGRLRLMPIVAMDADPRPTPSPHTGTQSACRHPRSQRIIAVLAGHLAIVHGENQLNVDTLGTHGVAWIGDNEPYALANVGNEDVVAVIFSDDPGFDEDTRVCPELDAPVAALLAPRLRLIRPPLDLWAG